MSKYNVGDKVKFNKNFVEATGMQEAVGIETVVVDAQLLGDRMYYKVEDTLPETMSPEISWIVFEGEIDPVEDTTN